MGNEVKMGSKTIESVTYAFGPLRHDGGVVFRLWAPAAAEVSVEIDDGAYPMETVGDGWYRSRSITVHDGTPYAFRINGDLLVPDPASRVQEDDVHGRSLLRTAPPHSVRRENVPGRRHTDCVDWNDTIVYELHVGTFTADGTFLSVIAELDRLKEIGFTVIELMPISDFPGRWNWGYDGVLPYAPDRSYGTPEELQALIDAVHARGMGIWLDVVYNHFGPDGNYLHVYAPHFFSEEIKTPWGGGIDFRRPEVRRFFIENALYWLEWYQFDGLRFDAVHAIHDPSVESGGTHILDELAATVRREITDRCPPSLVLENDRNQSRYLGRDTYDGQWNDDIHHAFHVLLTGESFGYYGDYTKNTEALLTKGLAEGFIYQGQPSPSSGEPRGEVSTHISPTRFVSFLQNHDQIGNRAFGERIGHLAPPAAVAAATTALLLSPHTPLVFMGDEVASEAPFQFFCDFHEPLADAVRTGRRSEFNLKEIPDPIAGETRDHCVPPSFRPNETTALFTKCLALRRAHLRPLLPSLTAGTVTGGGDVVPVIRWNGDEATWCIAINLSPEARPLTGCPQEREIEPVIVSGSTDALPPWTTVVWKEVR